MVNRPSVPEIITVNSEELQSQIRDLLPSQNGFGSELQATNVITPIIDLTRTAEGSSLDYRLQTALAFGSQTAFEVNNTTTVIANSPGFYRIIATSNIAGGTGRTVVQMSDGLSTKNVWQHVSVTTDSSETQFDYTFWLAPAESLSIQSTNANARCSGSVRQIADSEGTLTNPAGYPL